MGPPSGRSGPPAGRSGPPAPADITNITGKANNIFVIQRVETSKKCLEQRMDILENKLDQILKILSDSKK